MVLEEFWPTRLHSIAWVHWCLRRFVSAWLSEGPITASQSELRSGFLFSHSVVYWALAVGQTASHLPRWYFGLRRSLRSYRVPWSKSSPLHQHNILMNVSESDIHCDLKAGPRLEERGHVSELFMCSSATGSSGLHTEKEQPSGCDLLHDGASSICTCRPFVLTYLPLLRFVKHNPEPPSEIWKGSGTKSRDDESQCRYSKMYDSGTLWWDTNGSEKPLVRCESVTMLNTAQRFSL